MHEKISKNIEADKNLYYVGVTKMQIFEKIKNFSC